MEHIKTAFETARTDGELQRAKQLAEGLTGCEQLALIDTMIDASRRVADRDGKVTRRKGEWFVTLEWHNGAESGTEEMGPFDDETDAILALQRSAA